MSPPLLKKTQCVPEQFPTIASLYTLFLFASTHIWLPVYHPLSLLHSNRRLYMKQLKNRQVSLAHILVSSRKRKAECPRMKAPLCDGLCSSLKTLEHRLIGVLHRKRTSSTAKSFNGVRCQRTSTTESTTAAEDLKEFLRRIDGTAACDVVAQVSVQVLGVLRRLQPPSTNGNLAWKSTFTY